MPARGYEDIQSYMDACFMISPWAVCSILHIFQRVGNAEQFYISSKLDSQSLNNLQFLQKC